MGQLFLTLRDQPKYSKEKAKKHGAVGSKKIVQKSSCFYHPERYIRGGFVPSLTLRGFSSL
jgi:hypothetical protein